jgi:hypothetical protein
MSLTNHSKVSSNARSAGWFGGGREGFVTRFSSSESGTDALRPQLRIAVRSYIGVAGMSGRVQIGVAWLR